MFTLSCQVAEISERLSAILMMKRSSKISISVELTVCQKNVANALNSVGIML